MLYFSQQNNHESHKQLNDRKHLVCVNVARCKKRITNRMSNCNVKLEEKHITSQTEQLADGLRISFRWQVINLPLNLT